MFWAITVKTVSTSCSIEYMSYVARMLYLTRLQREAQWFDGGPGSPLLTG